MKRPVTAQLALMNFFGTAASGQAIVELKVVGVANSKSSTLIEESVTLDMVPAVAGSNIAEFEVKLPRKLTGKKFVDSGDRPEDNRMEGAAWFGTLDTEAALVIRGRTTDKFVGSRLDLVDGYRPLT